jgi:hypothetical protein
VGTEESVINNKNPSMAEEVQEISAQVEQLAVVVTAGVNKELAEILEVEDRSLWHHLIIYQELENDDQNDGVVCWLCQEPVLGCPAYKCLQCNFHQHKLCIDRPDGVDIEIEHKYWWKRHHLIFVQEPDINGGEKKAVCSVCNEPTFGPTYECSIPECIFILHKSCGELSNVIHHPLHSEHTLILQESSSTGNDCFFCRKNCSGSFFYSCSLCSFNLHIICASRRKINADDCHQHTFLSSRKINKFTCESCGEESQDIANLCSECGVLIHKRCDFKHTIKTRSHDHSLLRTYSLCQVEEQDNVRCKLCLEKISTEYGAYYCKKCDYIVHMYCASVFEDKDNNQSATTEADPSQLVHLVEGIDLTEDERAGPQEIKHFSHPQHNLILSHEKLMDDMRCEACMHTIFGTPFYGCVQCNFFLHNRCAKVERTIKRWLFHKHPLTLASSTYELFDCSACARVRQGFTYSCDECEWYKIDIQCFLIPETLTHEGHQHLLYLNCPEDIETCNACGDTDGNYKYDANYVVFRCTDCKFKLCLRCATLPLIAKYEFDTHLLKLSYAHEDNSEEYYCLICEKERDHPNHWFYSCAKCKFTAHTQCVIGKNPCINFGKTYINEKHHEHPLTIVKKADHSPPCDCCTMPFEGVAVECTQCEFSVHPASRPWGIDCLEGVMEVMEVIEVTENNSPDTAPDSDKSDGSDFFFKKRKK